MLDINKIYNIDCLEGLRQLPDNSINCIVTSPPYNKKSKNRKPSKYNTWSNENVAIDYGVFNDYMDEQKYQNWQIDIINECIRVLKPDGSFFYNHKNRIINKGLITPYEWILKTNATIKQEIIWDRRMIVEVDKVKFYPKTEKIFWLVKERKQPYFNPEYSKLTEIWSFLPTQREKRHNHPAPFPEQLAENCILASTKEGDIVLDIFLGSGTTAVVCQNNSRNYIGFELNKEYVDISEKRLIKNLSQQSLDLELE
jgi:modification methylase